MAVLAGFKVTIAPQTVTGLTAGRKYVIQNTNEYMHVEWINHTATTAADIPANAEWHKLRPFEYILEDHVASQPLWVRAPDGRRRILLAISEAEDYS